MWRILQYCRLVALSLYFLLLEDGARTIVLREIMAVKKEEN
jgi:hypothetical protein